jgi:hypothetical protein
MTGSIDEPTDTSAAPVFRESRHSYTFADVVDKYLPISGHVRSSVPCYKLKN